MSNNTLPFSDVYNNLGICTGLTTLGSYSIPSLSTIYNSVSDPTAPQSLGSGYFSNDIYSANYVQGQNGWKLFYNGNFEANNGTFRGNITATSGTIGGWTIGATTLTGGETTLNSNGNITGATITGGVIQTATSGDRVLMSGANDDIEFLNNNDLWAFIIPYSAGGSNLGMSLSGAGGRSIINLLDNGSNGFIQLLTGVMGDQSITIDSSSDSITMVATHYNLSLPTSTVGLNAGDLWNNGGVVNIV
jgi:hypothetical protein